MVNCDGLTLSGVTWKRPAFWGLHLIDCKNIHFDAVTIRFRNNNYNSDGLDLDGCESVLIQNCDIVADVTIEDREEATRAAYKNVKVENAPEITDKEKSMAGPITITGIPGHCVENVTLQNVEISFPGHGTIDDAGRTVPEDIAWKRGLPAR